MSAYAEIYGKDVSKEKLEVYAMLLKDMPLNQLEGALAECAKNCQYFPTVADIRATISRRLQQADQFGAEKAWNVFLSRFGAWHPDTGLSSSAPKPDPAGEYAERQIGSFVRFAASEIQHEAFIRKEFIDAYKRFHETGGMLAPSREEAARFLESLRKGELPE